jgi:dihydroorotase-like cyclic amidohydrolase
MSDLVLRSRRVVTPEGERPAAVRVSGGRIAAVEPYETAGKDLGDLALLPGLVDTHVHVNEPGRTHWEGFATATRAAAAGGVTTIVDMPLNSLPPTVDVDALAVKRRAATAQSFVDVGFWGGAVPGNLDDLHPLHDAGVFGFKCFLTPLASTSSATSTRPGWTGRCGRSTTPCSSCTPRTPTRWTRTRSAPPRNPGGTPASWPPVPAARRIGRWRL